MLILYRPGTIGGLGVCNQDDGQCLCKPTVDGDRKCGQCKDGFYQGGYSSNIYIIYILSPG